MKLTFLMSAFDRPESLWMSLGSLINQTHKDWLAVVLVNSIFPELADRHFRIVHRINDPRIRYQVTHNPSNPAWDCYWSSDLALEQGWDGDWLCFPSDDTYYMPEFAQVLIEKGERESLDLVYSDMIYDPRINGRRCAMTVSPAVGCIDKTGFIVRREAWKGFINKNTTYGPSTSDGQTIEWLVKNGISHGRVDQLLMVHN